MYRVPLYYPYPLYSEVRIGFERITYRTNESSPYVAIAVVLIEGELGRSVQVGLPTMDGTALSM